MADKNHSTENIGPKHRRLHRGSSESVHSHDSPEGKPSQSATISSKTNDSSSFSERQRQQLPEREEYDSSTYPKPKRPRTAYNFPLFRKSARELLMR
jgi:hypothetical protein